MKTLPEQPTALNPCPFCGGAPELIDGGPGCKFYRCTECRAATDDFTSDGAIRAWNRRAAPDTSAEAVALPDPNAPIRADLEALITKHEAGGEHDIGAFDSGCPTCRILEDLRNLVSRDYDRYDQPADIPPSPDGLEWDGDLLKYRGRMIGEILKRSPEKWVWCVGYASQWRIARTPEEARSALETEVKSWLGMK